MGEFYLFRAPPFFFSKAAAAAKVLTFRTSIVDATNATTYSGGVWNGIAIGDAAADRYVIVAVGGGNITAGRVVSSMTIGGVSASRVTDGTNNAQLQNSDRTGEIWIALVTSGTTANISITWDGEQLRCGAGVWTATGLAAVTANHVQTSTANPGSVTLNTLADGFAIGYAHSSTTGNTNTWTNATERFDQVTESVDTHSGADAATSAGTLNIQVTRTNSSKPILLGASW